MDFFAHQRSHRQRSRLLYLLFFGVVLGHFILAFLLLWWGLALLFKFATASYLLVWALVISAVLMAVLFGWGAFSEYQRLALGGRAVAKQANAKRLFVDPEPANWATLAPNTPAMRMTAQSLIVQDPTLFPPAYQRYYEIATQMAIAAGVPMPALYVLPHEMGINAFVAGRHRSDTVMVVSEGALQKLCDEALYGLIAHEYGHILHGDADFNLKMLVVMAGLNMGYAISHQTLEKNTRHKYQPLPANIEDSWSAISARQQKNQLPLGATTFTPQQWVDYWKKNSTVVEQYARESRWSYDEETDTDGSVLVLPAFLGKLLFASSIYFGRRIQQYFGQQCEFLADATSMQLTRSTAIIKTLQAIHQDSIGSQLYAQRLAKFEHFYFADCHGHHAPTTPTSHPSLRSRIMQASALG